MAAVCWWLYLIGSSLVQAKKIESLRKIFLFDNLSSPVESPDLEVAPGTDVESDHEVAHPDGHGAVTQLPEVTPPEVDLDLLRKAGVPGTKVTLVLYGDWLSEFSLPGREPTGRGYLAKAYRQRQKAKTAKAQRKGIREKF